MPQYPFRPKAKGHDWSVHTVRCDCRATAGELTLDVLKRLIGSRCPTQQLTIVNKDSTKSSEAALFTSNNANKAAVCVSSTAKVSFPKSPVSQKLAAINCRFLRFDCRVVGCPVFGAVTKRMHGHWGICWLWLHFNCVRADWNFCHCLEIM